MDGRMLLHGGRMFVLVLPVPLERRSPLLPVRVSHTGWHARAPLAAENAAQHAPQAFANIAVLSGPCSRPELLDASSGRLHFVVVRTC